MWAMNMDAFYAPFQIYKLFYKLLNSFGVDSVYNHADYRLMDNKIIQALEGYKVLDHTFLR